jgi:hypothetical protein
MSSTETKKKGSKQNSREFAPLTDKKLQAVKPRQKRYTLRDGRGLFLDVTPGGVRTWVAAGVDTDQPCDGSAASNLANRTRHFAA